MPLASYGPRRSLGALEQPGRWQAARPGFLFPARALSQVFRGKFIAGLKQRRKRGGLRYAGQQAPLADQCAFNHFLETLYRHDWVVYAKPACAGPAPVLEYLGRYTHRVAIANHRLIAIIDITRCPVCRTGELHPFPRLPNSTGPPVTHVA